MTNWKILPEQFDIDQFNKLALHPLQSWEWGEVRKKTGISVIRIGEFENETLKNVFTMTIHPVPYTPFKIGYIPRSILPTVGLLQSDEDLLKNMKSKTRYNIRIAEKKGVKITEESNDKGYSDFSDLYFKTTSRQDYRGHDQSYHKTVWNELKNSVAHILIARFNHKPLAAYELFRFKNRLYYPYGGSSHEHRDVMSSNLLMWEAIKFAKNKGCKYFDMWGAASPNAPTNDVYAGFTRFKEGYNGRFVEWSGSWDLVINYRNYAIYTILHKIRTFWLSLAS